MPKETISPQKHDDTSKANSDRDSGAADAQTTLEATGAEVISSPKTPPVQRSVEAINHIRGQKARREVFQSIQRSYGNAYAARVARSAGNAIQRHPADFTPTVDPQTAVEEIQN